MDAPLTRMNLPILIGLGAVLWWLSNKSKAATVPASTGGNAIASGLPAIPDVSQLLTTSGLAMPVVSSQPPTSGITPTPLGGVTIAPGTSGGASKTSGAYATPSPIGPVTLAPPSTGGVTLASGGITVNSGGSITPSPTPVAAPSTSPTPVGYSTAAPSVSGNVATSSLVQK